MAMTQENIRALDQLRQRLSLLSASIASLRVDLERNEPLPTWTSLQSSAQALSFNLQQLSETFQTHRQFLKEAHAYPLSSFPGYAQEGLLEQLLRKKLEPGAEDWVDSYTVKFEEQSDGGVGREELRQLWNWAPAASDAIVRPMLEEDGAFEDDFTIAEREAGVEKVVTGLRRKLDGEEEEEEGDGEDEGEDDKMEDVMPSIADVAAASEEAGIDTTMHAMSMESALKFASIGSAPGANARANR